MYLRHFGLKHSPFSIAPDPRYLFMSERHREALAHLLYGVKGGGGFVVLTGEIGAGKTTVCRCFLEQIPKRCNVAYIFNPKLTVEELLRSICAEFRIPYQHTGPGVPTVKDYVDALNEFLLRTHAVGQSNVLIIDEAQNLSPDVLEQLRLLTNLETNEKKLLQIVLIGQPELREMLARPELEQLAQRVIARYHLDALSEIETARYVTHRLSVAGMHQAMPFEARAMQRIYQYSRGVPRRINLLCDRSLLGAYGSGTRHVDPSIVDKSAQEVLDQPEAARPARARYERALLVGAGIAVGAGLAIALTLALTGRGDRAGEMLSSAAAPTTPGKGAASEPAAAPGGTAGSAAGSAAAGPAGGTAGAAGGAAGTGGAQSPAENGHAVAGRVFDLAAGMASLKNGEPDVLRELAPAWKVDAGAGGDPCAAVRRQQVACFRSPAATLALIRQLDRPGVLTLRDGNHRAAHVHLTGLTGQSATLRINGVAHSVPLVTLADYWRGEFATLWRVPPDYAGAVVDATRSPAMARWLALQLATARGDSRPVGARIDDATLRGWIHAFQLTQGLPSDGVAGPITLMQLNRVLGIDEPRLTKDL
jgi:general secretion pathway protein A